MKSYLLLLLLLLSSNGSYNQKLNSNSPGFKFESDPVFTETDFTDNHTDQSESFSWQKEMRKCYLIIDHSFTFSNSMVNYTIKVYGKIEVILNIAGVVYAWFPDEEVMISVDKVTGEGRVNVSGRGSINLPQFQVKKINYDSSMQINIDGITRWMKSPGTNGSLPFMNIELNENWNGEFDWDIVTSDPENDAHRLEMFKQIVPRKIPDSPHTGHTLEYYYADHRPTSTFEHISTVAGMGTFRWSYTLTDDFLYDERYRVHVNPDNSQSNFTEDRQKPKDYISTSEAKLGPPLGSITWGLVDPEGPLRRKHK